MARIERRQPVGVPVARDRFESHCCGWRGLGPSVPALRERELGLRATQAHLSETDIGVTPEGEQLLLAVVAIFQPPELGAVGTDEQMKSLAVGELIVPGPLRRVANLEFLERHWGYLRADGGSYP
jgi:hypothetical protein